MSGVGKSYAIQAGRELRIIVESSAVSDSELVLLSRDIAKKIESELTYPGQIKVTVFVRQELLILQSSRPDWFSCRGKVVAAWHSAVGGWKATAGSEPEEDVGVTGKKCSGCIQ